MDKYIMFRRRREKKTDYRQRLAFIKSSRPRMVIRRSIRNVRVQFVKFTTTGDVVVAEKISKNLEKFGWNFHNANLPASYLTGYLAGAEARSKGVNDAIVDIGLQDSIKASSLYCAALGAKDAGIDISIGKEVLPDKNRISGKHISSYAAKIKGSPAYQKQFSSYLKKGIDPEKIHEMFEHTKKEIAAKYNVVAVKAE